MDKTLSLLIECLGCGRKSGKPNTQSYTKGMKKKTLKPDFICKSCQKSFQEEWDYEMRQKAEKQYKTIPFKKVGIKTKK